MLNGRITTAGIRGQVLRGLFRYDKEEVKGGWERSSKGHHNLYSSLNICVPSNNRGDGYRKQQGQKV
jgi:hypothetical protein